MQKVKNFVFYDKTGRAFFMFQAVDHKQACYITGIPEDTDYEVEELNFKTVDEKTDKESEKNFSESQSSIEFNNTFLE